MASGERVDASGPVPDVELTRERRSMFEVAQRVDEAQRRGDTDVENVLRHILSTTVTSVPGAQYAGITVIDPSGAVSSLAPTHDYPAVLDGVQGSTGEGPCLSAAWMQHTILIDDLATETRWPRYRAEALDRTPVRSVLSFQLYTEGRESAALNFYAQSNGVFDEESVELGLLFAAHTSLAWNSLRRERQFRSALGTRDVIGQAKGILMERFDIDAVAAFDLLRKLSQENNTKLSDIAQRVVGTERPSRRQPR